MRRPHSWGHDVPIPDTDQFTHASRSIDPTLCPEQINFGKDIGELARNKAMKLYSFYPSSTAHRVWIALDLKGADYELFPVHLQRDGGEPSDESRESASRTAPRLAPLTRWRGKSCGPPLHITFIETN